VYLPGVAGNYLDLSDEAALDITDDVDIQVYVALDDYISGSTLNLVAKSGVASSTANYIFFINSTGDLAYRTGDGSSSYTATSTAALGTADYDAVWLRVVRERTAGTVKFYTSDDGSTWSQLGSTITSFYSGAANTNSDELRIGQFKTIWPNAGKFYRARVYDGVSGSGGTLVLDVDCSVISSGSATSLTALTGQTVTISRSTSGRKSVAVVSPVWLFGTDDQIEVADNALLDFDATDDFTLVSVFRLWDNFIPFSRLISKEGVDPRYALSKSSGVDTMQATLDDGVTLVAPTGQSIVEGDLHVLFMVVDRSAQTVTMFLDKDTSGTQSSISAVGSLVNNNTFEIGAGIANIDMENFGTVVYRRTLPESERFALVDYYASKVA